MDVKAEVKKFNPTPGGWKPFAGLVVCVIIVGVLAWRIGVTQKLQKVANKVG